MLDTIVELRTEIEADLDKLDSKEAVESFRLRHLVRKGTLQGLVELMRAVPREEKPAVGKALNDLRT